MVQTLLRIELPLSAEMQKEVQMPYALRAGDNLFDESGESGEGFDLTVTAVWFDLKAGVQMALIGGFSKMKPSDVTETKAELAAIGWREA